MHFLSDYKFGLYGPCRGWISSWGIDIIWFCSCSRSISVNLHHTTNWINVNEVKQQGWTQMKHKQWLKCAGPAPSVRWWTRGGFRKSCSAPICSFSPPCWTSNTAFSVVFIFLFCSFFGERRFKVGVETWSQITEIIQIYFPSFNIFSLFILGAQKSGPKCLWCNKHNSFCRPHTLHWINTRLANLTARGLSVLCADRRWSMSY